MFSKAVYLSLLLVSLSLQGHAHGTISPALGFKGTPVRSQVQRPSNAQPCGKVNPATALDSSQAAIAGADGKVDLTVTNFNGGADGSRKVSAKVSADGTGKNFISATMLTNGDPAPTNVGSQPLVVQLPPGTKCTGGKSKNLCLMSLQTTSGFGNCVAVQQGGGNANAAAGGINNAAAGGGNGAANAAAAGGNSSANAAAAGGNSSAIDAAGAGAGAGAGAAASNKNKNAMAKGGNGKGGNGKSGNGMNKGAKDKADAKGKAGQKAANKAANSNMGKGNAAQAKGGMGNAAQDNMNAKAAQPAGARAVRSIIASERDVVKRSGFSWIWA